MVAPWPTTHKVWDIRTGQQVADDAEDVIANVATADRGLFSSALITAANITVDAIDGDASAALFRIRRGGLDGPALGAYVPIPASMLNGPATIPVTFIREDAPGRAADTSYVLTVEFFGATGPTTGISAALTLEYSLNDTANVSVA